MGVCLPESGGSADPEMAPLGGDACTERSQTYRVGSELGPCPSAYVVSS